MGKTSQQLKFVENTIAFECKIVQNWRVQINKLSVISKPKVKWEEHTLIDLLSHKLHGCILRSVCLKLGILLRPCIFKDILKLGNLSSNHSNLMRLTELIKIGKNQLKRREPNLPFSKIFCLILFCLVGFFFLFFYLL